MGRSPFLMKSVRPGVSSRTSAWVVAALFGAVSCSLTEQEFEFNNVGLGAAAGTVGQAGNSTGGSSGSAALPGQFGANLVTNPGFEDSSAAWLGFGMSQVSIVDEQAHTGLQSLKSVSRLEPWMGPSYELGEVTVADQIYQVSLWVRQQEGSHSVSLSNKVVCPAVDGQAAVESYVQLGGAVVGTEWTELTARFVAPSCGATSLLLYLEGPPAGANFYIDDVEVSAVEDT